MADIKGLFAAKDLTQGTPWKRIVEFTIPMLIGNIAQQLYNTADAIIVGRYIGDNALASVGSAGDRKSTRLNSSHLGRSDLTPALSAFCWYCGGGWNYGGAILRSQR